MIALGVGVLLVAFLLFRSWNSVESSLALDEGSTPPKVISSQGAQARTSTTPGVPSSVSTQSLLTVTPSSSFSSSSSIAPVVRDEPKQTVQPQQPEEVFEVVEPAPTPVPVTVPAIYAQPAARSLLTEDQRKLLDQATADFNARIQSSGMSPYAPGYADLWKQSAQQADDIFRQQYGEDALQALKGGPPAPTPEPTPLSPQDDAFRARYGEDALEMRVLQREGRLIRVSQ
jgi:hypothetical protein